jgi:hypothetical protein
LQTIGKRIEYLNQISITFKNLGTILSRVQQQKIKGSSGKDDGACSALKCTYPGPLPGGGDREGSCGKQPMQTACTCNGFTTEVCTNA